MKRSLSILPLLLALVWATGALDTLHRFAERHVHTSPPSVHVWMAASTEDHPEPTDTCALCIALAGGTCCPHEAPSLLALAAGSTDGTPEPRAMRGLRLSSPQSRGPPHA